LGVTNRKVYKYSWLSEAMKNQYAKGKNFGERDLDLVSPNIKRYIIDRQKYLACNPEYHLRYGSRTKSKLEEEANKHSVSIELVNYSLTKSESVKAKAKEKKRSEKCITNARFWATENYVTPLTYEYLEEVGKRVDPISNPGGFRNGKVRISGSRVSPPSPEKLDRELRIFLWENEMIDNPLERALHAHFNIARIHPFEDGNGRTSRLIQDTILADERLPLAMIHLFERPEYIKRIEEAVYSYHQREGNLCQTASNQLSKLNEIAFRYETLQEEELTKAKKLARNILTYKITPEQNSFYDFIALKVLNGLTEELKRLYPSEREMTKYFKERKKKEQGYSRMARQNRESVYPLKNLN
jgi:prophage maintenance system killer protein